MSTQNVPKSPDYCEDEPKEESEQNLAVNLKSYPTNQYLQMPNPH